MRALGDAGQDVQHPGVHLPGIGLSGDRDAGIKPHLLRDHRIDEPDLLLISFEQFLEARLGAGGALAAEKLHGGKHVIQILEIQHQFVDPESGSFPDSGRLGRLEVSEGQGGQVLVPVGEGRQLRDDVQELFPDQLQGFGHEDDVGVVADVAAGGAEVDDAFRLRALDAVGIDVAHDVVPYHLLALFRHFIVHIVRAALQFFDLIFRDVQPQFLFRFRQGDPQFSPGAELLLLGKNVLHLFTCVALRQRAGVACVILRH